MTRIHELLLTAVRAALIAGKEILSVYATDFDVDTKADKSPLTVADRNAHQAITTVLEPTRIPILSEEGRDIPYAERKDWPVLWIVDPLDGTKEFIKRNDEFTVNIALVENNRPVLGVIFVPVYNRLYLGAAGMGAFKLDDPKLIDIPDGDTPDQGMPATLAALVHQAESLPLKRNQPPNTYTIVGSRSHATPELEAFVENARQRFDKVHFISAGSSLKFCLVAEGTADVYPRLGPTMEWDTAAGQAIAENATAGVTVWETGPPLSYNRENLLNPYFIVERQP